MRSHCKMNLLRLSNLLGGGDLEILRGPLLGGGDLLLGGPLSLLAKGERSLSLLLGDQSLLLGLLLGGDLLRGKPGLEVQKVPKDS